MPDFNEIEIDVLNKFPISERFANAASAYLAAIYMIDYNPEHSDMLFDIYCTEMARIESEIPAKIEKIAQRYL